MTLISGGPPGGLPPAHSVNLTDLIVVDQVNALSPSGTGYSTRAGTVQQLQTLLGGTFIDVAQYGIIPSNPDNSQTILQFRMTLAALAAPSNTNQVSGPGITGNGAVTIDIPSGVITIGTAPNTTGGDPLNHYLRNGDIVSFSTTGALPTGIVAGKRYYVQYGSVTPTTFQISETSIFIGTDAGQTSGKGVPVALSGTQSGVHSYQSYGEGWTDIVIPPGIYFAGNNDFPGVGSGLKKIRVYGYGARFQNNTFIHGRPWYDVNANTGTSQIAYQARFATSYPGAASISLLSPSQAPNFYVNSCVVVMCTEMQGQNVTGNWNQYTFEYPRIKANNVIGITSGTYNTSTGVITLTLPSIGAASTSVGPKAGLSSLTGTGAFASLNGDWSVLSVTGSGPYTVTLQGPTVAASTITGGKFSTGVLLFYDGLQYGYRSTLPAFVDTTAQFKVGPATIVQLNDTFDQQIEVYGVTFTGVTEEEMLGMLCVRLVDCEIYGWGYKTGPFPSTMKEFTLERCKFRNAVSEVDKMIDVFRASHCEWNSSISLFNNNIDSGPLFQSSNINRMVLEDCNILGGISGSTRNMTIRDSNVGFKFSIGTVYGAIERLRLDNCTISFIESHNQAQQFLPVADPSVTFSNGTIKILVGSSNLYGTYNGPAAAGICPILWAVPGAKIAICTSAATSGSMRNTGAFAMIGAFTVQDVYNDGLGNFCVDTDLAVLPTSTITFNGTMSGSTLTITGGIAPVGACPVGGMTIVATAGGTLPANTTIQSDLGYPNGANNLGNYSLSNGAASGTPTSFSASYPLYFLPHPAPRATIIGCTGGRFASDAAGAPADSPLFSYFKRVFSGGTIFPQAAESSRVNLAGNLVSWTVNVQKPYTGTAGSYVCSVNMFSWVLSAGNYYLTVVTQTINLKTAGIRTFTATNTTGSVAGDTLVAVPGWLSGGHWVDIVDGGGGGEALSKYPVMIMTATSYQGIEADELVTTTATSGLALLDGTVMSHPLI
jgi:hypothetical protein